MIDPDFFGCSGKLSFKETWNLASTNGRNPPGDFSIAAGYSNLVTSIDRVHRCSKSWESFARIALNHVFGDVICAGAKPIQAMLSFEFGIDTPPTERRLCSKAFGEELASRGIALGKCHSSESGGVTAVTVATLASSETGPPPKPSNGTLYINRAIGAFKLHYLSEMGIDVSLPSTSAILESHFEFQPPRQTYVTDISGHGLLGAAVMAARLHGLDIELELSADHAFADEVLSVPIDCLQNTLDSYGVTLAHCHPDALTLLTLRETAGPFLTFSEKSASAELLTGFSGVAIGRYVTGNGGVKVSWAG